jgi:hypothetical protein
MFIAKRLLLLFTCGIMAACATLNETDGVITLFDGSGLRNWDRVGDSEWRIVGEYVEGSGEAGHLVSKRSFDDFRLTLEFWTDVPANSGVYVRCSDPQEITAQNCYEVNIYDTREDQTYRTGSIVNLAAPRVNIDAANHWNKYEIIAQGPRMMVKLNGIETVDVEDDKFSSGPITLQYGTGIVRFRNVKIEQL